jgi:hypothetical protein
MQRWIVGAALLPIAILCAVAFCPINDLAMKLARRLGAGVVAFCDEIDRRFARSSHPQALAPNCE